MPPQQVMSRRAQRVRHHQTKQRIRVALVIVALVFAVIGGALLLASGGDDATTVELRLVDFGIEGDLEVEAGAVRIEAVNVGAQPHNIGIRGGAISNQVDPGGTISLDLGELVPGTYELYCDLTGHEDLGMVAPFVVTAG